MIGADTNTIIRFLIRDNESQAQKVKKVIENGETLFINQVVLSEIYYVLTKVYKLSNNDFIKSIDKLLETEGFEFFDNKLVKNIIKDFIESSAGFEDCMIHQLNASQKLQTITFDEKASKLKAMRLLK